MESPTKADAEASNKISDEGPHGGEEEGTPHLFENDNPKPFNIGHEEPAGEEGQEEVDHDEGEEEAPKKKKKKSRKQKEPSSMLEKRRPRREVNELDTEKIEVRYSKYVL